ncbi:hypothetical protein QUF76_02770 [Desulfobacterales bacterium HSG16]|nr:hypothetical protein [Desulfobacterales bacterium HSG16]
MCNPKKVMIHLTRSIEDAWQRTVEQAASASGEVNEMGRITAEIHLDEEMGDNALLMLENVLAEGFEGFEPWNRNSLGHYQRDLGEVTLIFNPQTGRLTVETQLAELISTEVSATAEACGFTVGEVAAEAVGSYYDDGWGGRTENRAAEEATALAEQNLDQAVEALHRQQNPEAFAAAEAQAHARAQEEAQEELAELQACVRDALLERLRVILSNAQDRVYHVMNRAVGEAYRQTLRHLVLENGGRILTDEKTGSVINMELELY